MLWRNRDDIMGMTPPKQNGMNKLSARVEEPMEDKTDAMKGALDATDQDTSSGFAVGPKADEYADWEAKQAALAQRQSQLRRQQFEEGKRYIEEAYRGPSASEQLMAISQALLAPRRYRGFAGTMSKLSTGFGGIQEAQRKAEQQRAQALMQLQNQYQTGELGAEGDALKNQLAVIKARAQAQKPQWARTVNPDTGEVTMTPIYAGQSPSAGGVNIPVISNPAQLATLPPNIKFFVAADDPTQTPRRVPGR